MGEGAHPPSGAAMPQAIVAIEHSDTLESFLGGNFQDYLTEFMKELNRPLFFHRDTLPGWEWTNFYEVTTGTLVGGVLGAVIFGLVLVWADRINKKHFKELRDSLDALDNKKSKI